MSSFADLGYSINDYPTVSVAADELAEIVIAIEDQHHQGGWDNTPPDLIVVDRVLDTGDGTLLAAKSMPGMAYDFKKTRVGMVRHPREEIAALAHHAGIAAAQPASKEREIMSQMYPRVPFAHILTIEAWGRTDALSDSPRNPDGSRRDKRQLADIPGSVEMRISVCVHDTHNVVLMRERGNPPRIMIDGDAHAWGGDLYTAIRELHRNARDLATGLLDSEHAEQEA